MSEASSSGRVRKQMREAGFSTYRVENKIEEGTPDLHYLAPLEFDHASGWAEFKWIDRAPVKPATPVKIKFRPAQPPWIRRYAEAGGLVWVFLAIGAGSSQRWMLFHGKDVDRIAWVPGGLRDLRATAIGALPTMAELEELNWIQAQGDWPRVFRCISGGQRIRKPFRIKKT